MKVRNLIFLILLINVFINCKKKEEKPVITCQTPTNFGSFTDTRDGNVYKTIVIGNQEWFAENLRFNIDKGSWNYNDDASLNLSYGKLYNFYAAISAIPKGWHLPTETEWVTLLNYLGGAAIAGAKMKECSTTHWNAPNEEATNSSGFSAYGGGYRTEANNCYYMNDIAYFWTATPLPQDNFKVYYYSLSTGGSEVEKSYYDKGYALSIRCVKD